MMEPIVVAAVELGPRHRPTGVTRHYYSVDQGPRVPVPQPRSLRLVQYADHGDTTYLFYCDDAGERLTDTFHDNPGQAMAQAEAEFGVQPHEWVVA